MELIGQFILGFLAAALAYVIHHSFGFRIGGWISSIPVIFLIMPLLIIIISSTSTQPSMTINTLNLYLTNFASMLPSLIAGHFGGIVFCLIFDTANNRRSIIR